MQKQKKQLNENLVNEFMIWFQTSWNDTSYYIDAYGRSEYTKGVNFQQNIAIFIGETITIGTIFQYIRGKLKVPGFLKKIYQIGKATLGSKSKKESDEKLKAIGLQPAQVKSEGSMQMQESKKRKIKNILTILESQVDRASVKKSIKENEDWLPESKIREIFADSGKMTVNEMMSFLKKSHGGKYNVNVARENAKEMVADMKKYN